MPNFLANAWAFEYALLPCIVAYLIFDLPIIIRRLTRRVYVPIYFAFFPAGYSDELLAKYFDEDYFWVVGGPYADEDLKSARFKILAVSVFSLLFTMALSPFSAALFGTYVLSDEQFTQFIWTLGIIKGALLLWAYYDMRFSFNISHRVPPTILAVIYLVYWTFLIYLTIRIHDWISSQNDAGGFSGVVRGLLDYLVLELGVGFFFTTVVSAILIWWLLDRRLDPDA